MEIIEVVSPAPKVRLQGNGQKVLEQTAKECYQHAYRYAVMLTKERLSKETGQPEEIAESSLELYRNIDTLLLVLEQVGLDTDFEDFSLDEVLKDAQQ